MGAIYALIPKWVLAALAVVLTLALVGAGFMIVGLKVQNGLQESKLAKQEAEITRLESERKQLLNKNAELAHALTEKQQAIEAWADEYSKYKKGAEALAKTQDAKAQKLRDSAATWEMLATRVVPPEQECQEMKFDLDKFLKQQQEKTSDQRIQETGTDGRSERSAVGESVPGFEVESGGGSPAQRGGVDHVHGELSGGGQGSPVSPTGFGG